MNNEKTLHPADPSQFLRPPRIVEFIIRLTALDGTDHWPSFNKIITVLIVLSYFFGKIIPPEVAIIVIASSFGSTGWSRYLKMKTPTPPS